MTRSAIVGWLSVLLLSCGADPPDGGDRAGDAVVGGDDDDSSNAAVGDDDDDSASHELSEYPCWFEATLTGESGAHSWSGACGTATASGIHFMVQPGSAEPHQVSRISVAPTEYLDPYCSFRVTINTCAQSAGLFGADVDELTGDFVRVKVDTEGCGLPIGRARTSSSSAVVSAELSALAPTQIDRSVQPGSITSSGQLDFTAAKTSFVNEEWTISGRVFWTDTTTTVGELGIDCP